MAGPGRWLLEFELGGSVQRYAIEPLAVTDSEGRVHRYRAGLADFSMRLSGLEEEQGVEVIDRAVNWALVARRGATPDRRPARLRYWIPGTVLERARVVLDGHAMEPQFGDPAQPGRLVFSLRVNVQQVLYPSASSVVDDSTWTFSSGSEQYDPAIEGAVYPTVFGYPGYLQTVSGNAYARLATPALLVRAVTAVSTSQVLLSLGEVDASTVRIYDPDGTDESGGIPTNKTDVLDVQQVVDDVGEGVAIATNFLSTPTVNDLTTVIGHRYYATWNPTTGGGITNGQGSLIRDLPDVLIWAMSKSGRADIDVEAQESERDRLGVFKVDGFINERLNTVDWIERQLATIFPIARVRSNKGFYWRFLDWDPSVRDAIDHIDADGGTARRSSPINTARKQIANRFTFEYGFVLDTGVYAARRILGPERQAVVLAGGAGSTDERVIGSLLCARSEADFGTIEATPMQSRFVWDLATAGLVLYHRALRDALPRLFVSYNRPDLSHLRRGDIVTVTDAEVGYTDAVAMVDSIEVGSRRLHRANLEILSATFRLGT